MRLLPPGLLPFNSRRIAGFLHMGIINAALTYLPWFRGIVRLESGVVSPLTLLGPAAAVLLGWGLLDQSMTPLQIPGIVIVIGSICAGQRIEARSH